MRTTRIPAALSGSARRFGVRHKTVAAFLGGSLAVLPAVVVAGSAADWMRPSATAEHAGDLQRADAVGLEGGYAPVDFRPGTISVDGSLPEPPDPENLTVYEPPETGPLGIPSSALKAYRNAARIVNAERPGCNVDWALIASIGRIESNHARGGYVDAAGDTIEPILGPVLNGAGPVAAIHDTDDGRHDGDPVWDRAVGPTQFIPGTWARYGADGNGDGVRDPNNIYDATVATARYLCSGGLDLAKEDQLRAALYRYNNSASYVETVIRWAEAYRDGVRTVPDSDVPLAVPRPRTREAPSPVDPPISASTGGGPQSGPEGQPDGTSRDDLPPEHSGPGQEDPDTSIPPSSSDPSEEPQPTEPPDGTTTPPDENCEDEPPESGEKQPEESTPPPSCEDTEPTKPSDGQDAEPTTGTTTTQTTTTATEPSGS